MVVRMVDTSDDIVVLTPDEVRHAIDVEARGRMGISGDEFIARWLRSDLPDTLAAREIGIIARLLDLTPYGSG
ncbi:MAG TPA: hypothetical protein VNL16_08695 [Chloroflexota bacterium]|nr:hypothetical protein [Chloroflexota bacterium]